MRQITCPRCGYEVTVPVETTRIRCPQCFETFSIGGRAAAQPAEESPPTTFVPPAPTTPAPPPVAEATPPPPPVPVPGPPFGFTPRPIGYRPYTPPPRRRNNSPAVAAIAIVLLVLAIPLAGVLVYLSGRTPAASPANSAGQPAAPRPRTRTPPPDQPTGNWDADIHNPRRRPTPTTTPPDLADPGPPDRLRFNLQLLHGPVHANEHDANASWVGGEVRNFEPRPIASATLVTYFLDASGQRLARNGTVLQDSQSNVRFLPPGGAAVPFSAEFGGVSTKEFSAVEIELADVRVAEEADRMVEVAEARFLPRPADRRDQPDRVVGMVRNSTGRPLTRIVVLVELFDRAGRMIERGEAPAETSGPLAPEQLADFTVQIVKSEVVDPTEIRPIARAMGRIVP